MGVCSDQPEGIVAVCGLDFAGGGIAIDILNDDRADLLIRVFEFRGDGVLLLILVDGRHCA